MGIGFMTTLLQQIFLPAYKVIEQIYTVSRNYNLIFHEEEIHGNKKI